MAIPYVSRKRLNPRDLTAEGKFYPAPAFVGEVGINQIAAEIAENTVVAQPDVIAVIRSLLQIVPKYLLLGYTARLDSFGLFKLGFKKSSDCKGYEEAGDVSAADIASLKIMFVPDVMLKARLEKPEFVKLDAKFIDNKKATAEEEEDKTEK